MRISRERQQAILERSTKAGHLPPELLAEFTRQPSVRLCLDRMGAAELQLHPKTGYMTADIPMWILNYGDKYVTIEAVEITVNDALFPLLSLGLYQWLELKPNGRESHEVLKISGRAPRGLGATATCRVVVYFTNGRNAELSITLPVVQVKPGPSGSRRERSSDALDLRQLMAAAEEANGDRKASDTEEGGSAKPTLPSPLKRLRRKSRPQTSGGLVCPPRTSSPRSHRRDPARPTASGNVRGRDAPAQA